MMGIGVDIIQISAFEKQTRDKSSVFVSGSFTNHEIQYANSNVSNRPAQHLAVRYAAKEAFIKAWSSLHFGSSPIIKKPILKEIEVMNDLYGRPSIKLHGQLFELVTGYSINLSLSHDGDYSIATVLLERKS